MSAQTHAICLQWGLTLQVMPKVIATPPAVFRVDEAPEAASMVPRALTLKYVDGGGVGGGKGGAGGLGEGGLIGWLRYVKAMMTTPELPKPPAYDVSGLQSNPAEPPPPPP